MDFNGIPMESPNSFCRACLKEVQHQHMYYIYTLDLKLRQWLQDLTLQNPEADDFYPKYVCDVCCEKLDSFLEFHQMCERSRQMYKEIMEKIPTTVSKTKSARTFETNETIDVEQQDAPDEANANCDWLEFDFVAAPMTSGSSFTSFQGYKQESHGGDETPASAHLLSVKQENCIEKYCDENSEHHDTNRLIVHDVNSKQEEVEQMFFPNRNNDSKTNESSDDLESKAFKTKIKKNLKQKSKSTKNLPSKESQISNNKQQIKHICEECGKICASLVRLKQHQYSHKPSEELPFHCTECNKNFRTCQSLNNHQMRHAGIKNYECPYCGMRKTTKSELRIHVNYHTKERQWLCPLCPMIFNSTSNLRRHDQVVHKGIRRYSCGYCDEAFGKKETLKHHEMTHTGEKPHKCPECGKRFIQSVSLKTHMKTHKKN